MASFVLPLQERAASNLTKASPSRRPAHLLSDKLVHVLILRQDVIPVQPSTDPHGPNLFWSLREHKVTLFQWPLKPRCSWIDFHPSWWMGGCWTDHSFAEQLEDLHEQHCSFPQRHKRFGDLPTGRMDPVSCVKTNFSPGSSSARLQSGPADMKS